MVPGRSEHIPGHSATFYTMSSRYFVKSLTLVHGFLHWKELGLRALICFWAMDFLKYLGGLVPSDEEVLYLDFGWWI